MPRVEINTPAPDFTLGETSGNPITLSDYRTKKNVMLVFNRGFV